MSWGAITVPPMAPWTMKDLAAKMRGLDLTMLSTHSTRGHIASRPMSNNGEVDFDGTSYFFTWADSRMVEEIRADRLVALDFQRTGGREFLFVQVQGTADLLTSKAAMTDHWHPELERWFTDGLDTEGLVMIRVNASRVAYWSADGDGVLEM